MLMLVLLLLGAFVSKGLSFYRDQTLDYGSIYFMMLRGKVDTIEFSPTNSSNVTILWNKGTSDEKLIMTGYYRTFNVTQENSGRYIMRDKDKKQLVAYTLQVRANRKTYRREQGSSLSFTYKLEPKFCNVYFFPGKIQPGVEKKEIVRQGKLQRGLDSLYCAKFEPLQPCGISLTGLTISCKGRYEIRDQNDNTALEVTLEVKEITSNIMRKPGERLNLTANLDPHTCNIYFYQDGRMSEKTQIVRKGRLQESYEDPECEGFALLRPCGIVNEHLQMSCGGLYEIRDQDDNLALELNMDMEDLPYETSYIGVGVSALLVSLCCGCVKRCCCGKSSSKEDKSETAAAEPEIQEYDHEPVGPRRDLVSQPPETNYPAQPSCTPTAPLIHHIPPAAPPAYSEINDYPSVSLPPAYSEISAPAPAEPTESTEPADAPTVSVLSDPGPQFELRGMTFPSAPLSSDSAFCDVYSSDKMNFNHL